MVPNHSSTPTSILDWLMVLDEVDIGSSEHTTHDNRPTRTLNNGNSVSEKIISKYLKPSRVMSCDKNVLCSICQESFEDDENVGRLDYDHEFHFSCIKSWLIIKNKCPNYSSSAICLLNSL
ncbi:hypothetical protein ZOSMA_66G00830 [Zostera marina]|uniref:RING-type E3 ubiquitin transferase n=1 Tax=Zostera marina TaxID=29655 RepID=A0A0K9NST6_ZOSMR|nr:hypothetical protein ZOSMA_66G00830 [Zostera marina]